MAKILMKKRPIWLFFKHSMTKITNVLTMVNYIYIRSQIVWKAVYFLPKKLVLSNNQDLTEKNSNISRELKITCYSLSVFIVIKLRTI